MILSRWHFLALNLMCQVFAHSIMVSRSCCSCCSSEVLLILLYRRTSSANNLIVVKGEILAPISLTYRRNIRGPNTVPWRTPERSGESAEEASSRTTLCCLWHNHDSIHLSVFPVIPWCSSLYSRPRWGTVSKALLKSRIRRSVVFLLSSRCERSSTVVKSWVSQEWFGRNPCWNWARMSWSSRWFIVWLKTTCSMVLHRVHVRDTGL